MFVPDGGPVTMTPGAMPECWNAVCNSGLVTGCEVWGGDVGCNPGIVSCILLCIFPVCLSSLEKKAKYNIQNLHIAASKPLSKAIQSAIYIVRIYSKNIRIQ